MAAAPISYLGQVAETTQKTHNQVQSVNDHNQRLAADVAEPEKLYQQASADEKAGWPPQELGNVIKGPALDIFGQRTNRARSYSSLEEIDQYQEDPRISQMRPSCDGPVSSSSRKDEEQQKLKQLQEQEQARALVATLQMVNMFLCYYAQRLYPQTHGTSPTSVSGFNNTTITGDVNISNTITNSDGTEVPRPKTPSGEKGPGDILPHHSTRTFHSGLVCGSGTALTALFLIYATSSLIYYQCALPERFPVN